MKSTKGDKPTFLKAISGAVRTEEDMLGNVDLLCSKCDLVIGSLYADGNDFGISSSDIHIVDSSKIEFEYDENLEDEEPLEPAPIVKPTPVAATIEPVDTPTPKQSVTKTVAKETKSNSTLTLTIASIVLGIAAIAGITFYATRRNRQ